MSPAHARRPPEGGHGVPRKENHHEGATGGIHDDQAERNLAAVACISRHGALLAAERLAPHHFRDPRCWAVIEAACLIEGYPAGDLGPVDDRIEAVAIEGSVWAADLRSWLAECPVMWDTGGHFADRVIAAHGRRERLLELVAQLEELGVTVEVVP